MTATLHDQRSSPAPKLKAIPIVRPSTESDELVNSTPPKKTKRLVVKLPPPRSHAPTAEKYKMNLTTKDSGLRGNTYKKTAGFNDRTSTALDPSPTQPHSSSGNTDGTSRRSSEDPKTFRFDNGFGGLEVKESKPLFGGFSGSPSRPFNFESQNPTAVTSPFGSSKGKVQGEKTGLFASMQ